MPTIIKTRHTTPASRYEKSNNPTCELVSENKLPRNPEDETLAMNEIIVMRPELKLTTPVILLHMVL